MKISIANLLFVVCLVGLILGWYIDRQQILGRFALEKTRIEIGDRSYHVRESAVREISDRNNIRDLPFLIYALGDPDVMIAELARDSIENITQHKIGISEKLKDESNEIYLQGFRSERIEWIQWLNRNHPKIEYQMLRPPDTETAG